MESEFYDSRLLKKIIQGEELPKHRVIVDYLEIYKKFEKKGEIVSLDNLSKKILK